MNLGNNNTSNHTQLKCSSLITSTSPISEGVSCDEQETNKRLVTNMTNERLSDEHDERETK